MFGSVSAEFICLSLPISPLISCSLTVTGASGGLGHALAEAVLASGECVVATARRVSALDDLKQRYPASQLLILALDVSVNEQIDQAFKNLIDYFGRLDVVVNNAGYVRICLFSRLSFQFANDLEI